MRNSIFMIRINQCSWLSVALDLPRACELRLQCHHVLFKEFPGAHLG